MFAEGSSTPIEPSDPVENVSKPSSSHRPNPRRQYWPRWSGYYYNPTGGMCRYILQKKECPFGDRCRFAHSQPTSRRQKPPTKNESGLVKEKPATEKDQENAPKESEKAPTESKKAPKRRPRRPPLRFFQAIRSTLEKSEMNRLLKVEINGLRKRFPKLVENPSENDKNMEFLVQFVPTDPDWPFDVESIQLKIVIPDVYPMDLLKMVVDDESVPELLRRTIDSGIGKWLEEEEKRQLDKDIVQLVIRPLMLWLDQNIRMLFVDGLRKVKLDLEAKRAGISLVLPKKPLEDKENEPEEESEDEEESEEDEEESSTEEEEGVVLEEVDSSKKPEGIQLRVQGDLGVGIGTLAPKSLMMVVHCARCHHRFEVPLSCGSKISKASGSCERCNVSFSVEFESGLVHESSSVLGYVRVQELLPADLVLLTSQLICTCLACNKQSVVNGLSFGYLQKTWCHSCNAKLELRLDSVRFHSPAPLGVGQSRGEPQKEVKKKPVKDPRIRPGEPLPDQGTCKHFKKSFRWFRFPCCGKTFPCDECHEENESHEMKLANRIICGFCAKEQKFNGTKPCITCGGHVTMIRSAHWEGGRGCRDPTKMSRKDKQKARGGNKSALKTAMKKAKK